MTNDERFMQMALKVASLGRGQTSPNPMVGAVVVKNGEVVGQGAHLKAGTPHAEVHALRMAGDMAAGATVYVTLEPCSHYGRTPPCCEALIAAKVQRVVVAVTDPNPAVSGRGIEWLRKAGIQVDVGICAEQAAALNEAYFHWQQYKRPFVVWKCAATLDGRIATENGHSTYVTGEAARQEVQALRQAVDAIGVGVGTVLADNPRLTVRSQDHSVLPSRQPVRVIFDSRLRTPPDAQLLEQPGTSLIYCTDVSYGQFEMRRNALVRGTAEVVPVAPDEDGKVSLQAALADLGRRGCTSILVEGGSQLASALLKQQLTDKIVYYIAPKLLGAGIPALNGPAPAVMSEAILLNRMTWAMVGSDLRMTGYPSYPVRNA